MEKTHTLVGISAKVTRSFGSRTMPSEDGTALACVFAATGMAMELGAVT